MFFENNYQKQKSSLSNISLKCSNSKDFMNFYYKSLTADNKIKVTHNQGVPGSCPGGPT